MSFYRFSVDNYHQMIESGILTEDDNVELLDGYVVQKMPHNPPHEGSIENLQVLNIKALPKGWLCRVKSSITLSVSQPEPDLAIVRGDRRTYFTRHPNANDFGILIEVAVSSLPIDRTHKLAIYARDGVHEYWIVNIPDMQIEVYTSPQPAAAEPHYAVRTDYRAGASVPVVLDGQPITAIPVADILP